MLEYQIVYSARRTLAIQIKADGSVVVRAPKRCSKALVEQFVREKQDWAAKKQMEILRNVQEREQQAAQLPKWTAADYREQKMRAAWRFKQRVVYYAEQMGVSYGRITVRDQQTRWGSCSTQGNLNFNWRLILAPQEVLDYVVVHELAHRVEMNHSERFWSVVESVLPDYRQRRQWLRKHGDMLMLR